MRDRERSQTPNGARVALIGDSFTEGLHVADEDTVSRRLEALLGGEAEVLNFGVSSTGTAVQLMNYRARVRAFRSDVVLLMFYVGNDIADNLPALKQRMDPGGGSISPYLVLDSGGKLAENPQPGQRRRTSPLVALASSSAIGQWASRAYAGVPLGEGCCRPGTRGGHGSAGAQPAAAAARDRGGIPH